MIRRAYKFRLYPTPEQEEKLRQCGGNARWLWNYFLRLNEEEYAKNKKFIFAHDLMKLLPDLKKEYEFLSLSWSQSLQQVAWHFDRALKDFLNPELKRDFPTTKKKAKERDSFTIPQKYRIEKKYVCIPKVGEVAWVKHRGIKGKVKHITVKQDGDQWYCSVNVEIKSQDTKPVGTENIIGIDVGLKTFATHSDGEIVENQRVTKRFEHRLKKAQRRLSKRTKGGSNRSKQRIRVSRLHRKIRNIRRDFQHKSTCSTIAKCDGVCLETLNIKGMMSNHTLAKAVADCGWYEYKRQLRYKADWQGKVVVEIDRFAPSSKCCSECGWKNDNLRLSDRLFVCSECGLEIDRDMNAAINIRCWGLKQYRGTHGNSRLGMTRGCRASAQCLS